ncbi:hypothetical protein NL30_25150 [Burkholderia contaminans]|uniref:DNA adenine methylase n=1 Tax=Burkholderia contaminans TaxID=488447 RepID=UPI00064AD2AA|nr:DNA adenine methylase [Burkholderia contaminans]AKM43099.1 hypothetical protein NL30_25150 [Burkholderia contaminans]
MTYPGGKGQLFRRLINLIPEHETYIEAYLGMGAVLRNKLPASVSIGIESDPEVLARWRGDEVPNLRLVQRDALEFLRSFEFKGAEFIYLDPPYLPTTRRRSAIYRHEYTSLDHEALLDVLVNVPCPVMISGYGSDLYSERLRDWRELSFSVGSHGCAREERVWLNYDPPTVPADLQWVGESYRDRQRIRRKQERLRAKIVGLPDVERALLLNWMRDTFSDQIGVRVEPFASS